MAEPLVITRVTHSCHLIQIGGMTVLTDPWFTQRPLCHQGKPYPRPDAECSPECGHVHHEFVDVRFCDLPGMVQHFTAPAESFDDKVFTDGLMFDGSSIRGFQQIHESDMLLPDPATAVLDPFRADFSP